MAWYNYYMSFANIILFCLDGTINASERNPKPLREFLPHRSSGAGGAGVGGVGAPQEHRVSSVGVPAKGPSRPLPPTPDDDDTMRRGGNSPAIRTNMPDLLPQTPSTTSGPPTPLSRGSQDSPGLQGGNHPPTAAEIQQREKSFLSFGFGAGGRIQYITVWEQEVGYIILQGGSRR